MFNILLFNPHTHAMRREKGKKRTKSNMKCNLDSFRLSHYWLSYNIPVLSLLCISFALAQCDDLSHAAAHHHNNPNPHQRRGPVPFLPTGTSTATATLPLHRSNVASFSHSCILLRGGGVQQQQQQQQQEQQQQQQVVNSNPIETFHHHYHHHDDDEDTDHNDSSCYHYTKVAILNLSQDACLVPPRREYRIQPIQDGESPLVSFIMEKWIKPQWEVLVVPLGGDNTSRQQQQEEEDGDGDCGGQETQEIIQRGEILAVPSRFHSKEMEFLEGSFIISSKLEGEQQQQDGDDKGLGDIVETIGCLVDCIVLFYDTSFSARQSCIVRLIKGIERQRNSGSITQGQQMEEKIADKGNSTKVQIVILAMDSAAHEELIAIKDVIGEGDEGLGNMIHIVPFESHRMHPEVMRNVLIQTVERTANVNAAVPMALFPRLAKRVYSRVGWASHQYKTGKRAEIVFETRRLGLKEKKQQQEDRSADKKEMGGYKSHSSLEVLPAKDLKYIVEQSIERFTIQIDEKLGQLEIKQDEVLLDETKMPILEFGRDATHVLSLASNALNAREIRKLVNGVMDSNYVESRRSHFISMVNDKVRRLFENQINSLREYYGRKYETVIEKLQDAMSSDIYDLDKQQMTQRRIKFDKLLAEEAKRSTEGFRAAAENAIPGIVKNGELKSLGTGYAYDTALDGLIRDMMKATSDSQNLEDEWESLKTDNDEPEDGVTMKKPRGPLKWYEKLAARALVFGVNYLQGWLAYQGIKKAAAERDRMMPKFPLF